jgi:rhodanese-related sulfurtransferase
MFRSVTGAQVRELLLAGGELAMIDVREQGVHYRGHPFFACSIPLSRLELMVGDLLPRKAVPIVVLDSGHECLAERAAAKLTELGYSDIAILEGGCAGWVQGGGELFSGMNVPSKAFGEFVEHTYQTPRITPAELLELQEAGQPHVILDSRPFDEYNLMNIPGSIDAPGAELAWRVRDLAPDPDTLVVVNCAGRTRSIIGCQSLRNAGIPNRVVALKDGTMGWDLAGYTCERGSNRVAPPPDSDAAALARSTAAQLAERFEVGFVDAATVRGWQADSAMTLYLLDVRSAEEFAQAHIAGSRHAPGGQVVQSTDEFIAVRCAHVVLIDPQQVRAIMTASWLNQMGLNHIHVLLPEGEDGFEGWPVEVGAPTAANANSPRGSAVSAAQLAAKLGKPGLAVINLATSLSHTRKHIRGAYWAVRSRLDEAREAIGLANEIVFTADDPRVAELAALEAVSSWEHCTFHILEGGNQAWFKGNYPVEVGMDRLTTAHDDIWYKPYELGSGYAAAAQAYLQWEVGLPEQVARDPTIRFRRYPLALDEGQERVSRALAE